jgi:glycosyltransferase involved in cell wall biosynthesis
MWPLDLPAREVLKLPGQTPITWAVFDPGWYLRTYPEVASIVGNDNAAAVLQYYLDSGQRQGHSPNPLFDEAWHRQRYPALLQRVEAGQYPSVFDAYCRRGSLDRSGHWLFDELAYRDRYPDLTNAVLATFELCNGYDHYLRHGGEEDRVGHPLFDPRIYLAHFDPADVMAIRQIGAFQHYLTRIESGQPELRTSVYFDPDWYLKRYPEVARDIQAKRWKCALHHYICNDNPTAFDPLEGFSESWYLGRDPGLRSVVAAGNFRNGYMHFLRFGAHEQRSPAPSIDLVWYAKQPVVDADLKQARAPNAFAHWLAIGMTSGLASMEPPSEQVTDAQARTLRKQMATALLPIVGRFGVRFTCPNAPVVSVVMVVRDNFAITMATIASLRANTAAEIELIVIDSGSEDETNAIGRYVPGAKVVRFDSDIGWAQGRNAGRQLATARAVLFLSSQAQLAPGAVEHALARLVGDPTIGAVGGMILQAHGPIAQAGGILWSNGGVHSYKHGASALDPEANFVRDVDFCDADFLLVRASVLAEIDGFDADCAPGYAAADLCVRIAQSGFRVVYDPSARIVAGDPPMSDGGGESFQRKHAALLAGRFAPGGAAAQVFARHAGVKPHRVLFIEDTVPLRRTGSGFVRANDLVRVMASLGCAVTVFPVNGCDHDPAHVFADMPDTVEAMHTLALDRLGAFLRVRRGCYDTVWVARTHNLAKVRPVLAQLTADSDRPVRIVLDTEALVPYREAIQAELAGETYDLDAAMQTIRADAAVCQLVVAVTEAEAGLLRSHDVPHVAVVGHAIEPRPSPAGFTRRSGMLFVGAMHKMDSPNFDSLVWFVESVLPLIEAELKWETRLTIAGYIAPEVDLSRFHDHPRITLRGSVGDLAPLFNSHRVFVAPTRYAAGAPYKVLEAASFGIPVVASELLVEELGWIPDQDILSASVKDPARFAALVVAAHRDEALWESIREGALFRVAQGYQVQVFERMVIEALQILPKIK